MNFSLHASLQDGSMYCHFALEIWWFSYRIIIRWFWRCWLMRRSVYFEKCIMCWLHEVLFSHIWNHPFLSVFTLWHCLFIWTSYGPVKQKCKLREWKVWVLKWKSIFKCASVIFILRNCFKTPLSLHCTHMDNLIWTKLCLCFIWDRKLNKMNPVSIIFHLKYHAFHMKFVIHLCHRTSLVRTVSLDPCTVILHLKYCNFHIESDISVFYRCSLMRRSVFF